MINPLSSMNRSPVLLHGWELHLNCVQWKYIYWDQLFESLAGKAVQAFYSAEKDTMCMWSFSCRYDMNGYITSIHEWIHACITDVDIAHQCFIHPQMLVLFYFVITSFSRLVTGCIMFYCPNPTIKWQFIWVSLLSILYILFLSISLEGFQGESLSNIQRKWQCEFFI